MNGQSLIQVAPEVARNSAVLLRAYAARLEQQLRGMHDPDDRASLKDHIANVLANASALENQK